MTSKLDQYIQMFLAIRTRIRELEKILKEEDGSSLSQNSVDEFYICMELAGATRSPRLFVPGNGTLRAVWRDDETNQVGLHFLGNEEVHFVLSRSYPEGPSMTSIGVDRLGDIVRRIESHDLLKLLRA
jgi:hypothetical protein